MLLKNVIVKLSIKIRMSRFACGWLLPLLALFTVSTLQAEGIKDVAPNAASAPVMLETAGDFAAYDGDPNARLIVEMTGPEETLFLGLSAEFSRQGEPFTNLNFSRYNFRIVQVNDDGTTNVVHGPFTVGNDNANLDGFANAEFPLYPTTDPMFVFQPTVGGTYAIEFEEFSNDRDSKVNIAYWDFAVVRGGAEQNGRLYSKSWGFRTPQVTGETDECEFDRQFNGSFFSYTAEGFVSEVDFADSGFQGLSFSVAFNSRGPSNAGSLALDRRSVDGADSTLTAAEHLIFLTEPDESLFPSDIQNCGVIAQVGESFRCDQAQDFPYCLTVEVTKPGQIDILLDFNENGILDTGALSQDRVIVADFSDPAQLTQCIPWNGLRGDGTRADYTDTVGVIITYTQGVQHYSAYDVEFMKNGFTVQTIRPNCGSVGVPVELYWDDRDIALDPGIDGIPKDNRTGSLRSETPRAWNNFSLGDQPDGRDCSNFFDSFTEGYGDKSTLNTWWFASMETFTPIRIPVVSAFISGPQVICMGDTSMLVADDPFAVGELSFVWSGPGVDGLTTGTVPATMTGEYCVDVTDSEGCSGETCYSIEVLDFDNNQFPDELSICFGDDVQLPVAGRADYSYEWSPNIGIDDVNSSQPTFNPEVTTVYTATITNETVDGLSCQSTETITVTVAPDIGLEVLGGGPICDATTTLTATTQIPATVVLFDPTGVQIGTGTSFDVPVSGESDYVLVATDAAGCTDTITFTVSGGPVDISLPDTVLNCTSEGVNIAVQNLDANDVLTYVWSPAELFDPETINSATPTFIGGPGDYLTSVEVTNQYNCTTTEEVRVILINDDGALSFTPMVDCDGRTVSFTNTSTVPFGYVYDFGDGNTSNETSPTHVYGSVGTFTVTLDLIYNQDCVASFTQEVTTSETLVDAAAGVALGDCDNGTATINFTDNSINATGTPLTYAWTFTGADQTESMDANPSVTVSQSGTVTASLSVTSSDNCTSTFDTTFTVDLSIVNLQDEVTICPGATIELNPGAVAGQTYTWSPSPDFDPNEPNPVTGVAGTYSVTVASTAADLNCSNVDMITVVIADSIGLVVNGPNGPVNDGNANGNGGAAGDDGDGDASDGDAGGNEVVLPSVNTCGGSIDLDVDLMTSDDVTVTYTDLDGNVIGTGGMITLSPDGRDTVVVTAVNSFGCIERDTIILVNNQVDAGVDVGADGLNFCSATDTSVLVVNNDPNDVLTYMWEANDIISGPLDGESVDITSPAEGSVDLMVTVTNQFGCDTMITVTVTATPFTPNEYPPVILPCYDDEFTITGGDRVDGYEYVWEPSENLDLTDPANPVGTFTEDGSVMVTITDPLTGCSSSQTIQVDVAPEIDFMVSPADTAVCEPTMVTVGGSSVNDDVNITWYSDAELMNEIGTGGTFTIDAAEPGQTYTIYGQAVDPNTGCQQTTPVTVTVSDITSNLPLPNIAACAGETPSIFGEVEPSGDLTYSYEPAGSVDASDPSNPVFTGTDSEVITVTITDPATGCTTMREVDVTVTDLGDLTGSADPSVIILGSDTELTVQGCDDCGYDWMPPNGTITGNGSTVTATPDEAGDLVYDVEVSQNGCTEIVMIEVRVEDPLCDTDNIYIPNAFTPNGDGMNDEMRVRSNFADQLTEFRFIIYDRWGQEVYSSDDIFESWDGTTEGDDLEPDVYGYWLRVRCPAGQELIQQGNITILR